jgi:predicted nucleic acid-binding protein
MPTVSNTSPILNLAIVGHLDLIRNQFGKIIIPPAVLQELKIQEERPGSVMIRQAVAANWIQVHEVDNPALVQLLRQTLDAGESEAIALAIETHAEKLLLDERDARKVAKSFGLSVTGVLGILLRAKAQDGLSDLSPVIAALMQDAGFRIAPELLAKILTQEPPEL